MPATTSQITALVKKELLLEVRQQHSFFGILLYIAATIFILYLTIPETEAAVWSGLFWVIQLFISINAVAKSFLQEPKERLLYYYSIVSPTAFILAKLIFSTAIMVLMSLLSLFLFTLFLGNPLDKVIPFIGVTLLGGWSFSLIFTFLSAIAASANQNAAIMAVLGLPLIVPQILLLTKVSKACFVPLLTVKLTDILLLAALDGLIIILAVILFPFLWRD